MLDLSGASLASADLTNARLGKARLGAADFLDATLDGTDLRGTDLSEVEGLTREQIESAITDENTILPDYLKKKEDEAPQEAGAEGES